VVAGPRGDAAATGFAVESQAGGAGGTLKVDARSIEATGGGLFSASNDADGPGGRLEVAAGSIAVDGLFDPTGTGFIAEGRAGATAQAGSIVCISRVTGTGTLEVKRAAG
jgi:hypothetical protein